MHEVHRLPIRNPETLFGLRNIIIHSLTSTIHSSKPMRPLNPGYLYCLVHRIWKLVSHWIGIVLVHPALSPRGSVYCTPRRVCLPTVLVSSFSSPPGAERCLPPANSSQQYQVNNPQGEDEVERLCRSIEFVHPKANPSFRFFWYCIRTCTCVDDLPLLFPVDEDFFSSVPPLTFLNPQSGNSKEDE
ncbi:Uncharacterized protein HZ326_5946 [Fusarium oxysporum f. sp. albedinis]|nr:Uncharacterized protein HZ326_5946 [Fusarium oxysporum f. sp. albedinis]